MMKKLLAMILTLSMVLVLAACDPAAPVSEPEQEEQPSTGEFLPDEQLQSAADQAQTESAPEEPAEEDVTEDMPGVGVGTVESYWYESDAGSGQYTDSVGNEMSYTYAVPAFNVDSPDASAMNEELEAVAGTVIEEMKAAETDGYSLMYTSVDYEAYQNGDIVSLLLIMNTDIEVIEYHVFNLNVVTGERASGAEMALYAGMDEAAFVEAAMTATETKFQEMYSGLEEELGEFYDEQYAKTMSADVFSLSAPMYLNGEGKICIIARIYALAGASYYDHILTLG